LAGHCFFGIFGQSKMSLSLPASLDCISTQNPSQLFAEMRGSIKREPKKRILLAEGSAASEILHAALDADFDLQVCHTLHHARECLHGDIRIVLCGLHFDGCGLFELLQTVRQQDTSAPRYFFGINTRNKLLADEVIGIAAESIWAMGGDGLINFSGWCTQLGPEMASQRLRRQLECLPIRKKASGSNLVGGPF
jgi:hypothetical protein